MTIHDILRNTPDLLPSEKLILSILSSHAGRKGSCWPAQGTIAREAGLTRKTVWTALKRLEAAGLVKSEARKRPDGGKTSKVYRICVVTTTPMCNGYTTPCETVTQPHAKRLHTFKIKNIKTKKEETTTTPPPPQVSGPQAPPAEKLCAEGTNPPPVVDGGGQHQAIPEIPGLSQSTAEGLARRHGISRFLEVASLAKDKKNPAGWARSALEGGWLTTPPAVAVDTKKNEEYKQLMTLWEALPETERRRAYLRGGGFGSPEMPNYRWLKKFFNERTKNQAV